MGFKAPLMKNNNRMGLDFPEAYWSIDNVRYSNAEGVSFVAFDLNAYPSREAKKMMGQPIGSPYMYGTSDGIAVNSIIYSWFGQFMTSDIFPSGIPLTEKEQKNALYPKVKDYCNDSIPFEDVLEEGNLPEEAISNG